MPRYEYIALSKSGERLTGSIDAADEHEVSARIQSLGHFPIRTFPERAQGHRLLALASFRRKALLKSLSTLTRELAILVSSGLTVDRSLDVLARAQKNGQQQQLLTGLLERIRTGSSLADAMSSASGAFPSFYISTVRAAERGGFLGKALSRLADLLARSEALRTAVRSALIYPCVLLSTAATSVTLIVTLIVPEFMTLFADAHVEPPLLLRAADWLSAFLAQHGVLAMLGVVAALLAARAMIESESILLWRDKAILKLPVVRDIVLGVDAGRLARNLASLLENGVVLSSALPLVRDMVSNRHLQAGLGRAESSIREGRRLATALERDALAPSSVVEMIRIGEETGRLPEMLIHAADALESEVRTKLDRLMSLLVPAITIVLGVIVAALVASVISVLVSINELAA